MSTLAEQLGYGSDERIAVVHVDDLGMCHAANLGAFEALNAGPATCGSAMAPCAWFSEAAAQARANPGLDIGVHLTLNSEWEGYRWGPVLGAKSVPTLVDEHGYLKKTVIEVVAMADAAEVEREARAQIQHALDSGIDVTHLDAHMGTMLYNVDFLDAYIRLGKEFAVPVFFPRPAAEQLEGLGLADAAPIFAAAAEKMDGFGLPVFDHFDIDSLGFAAGTGLEHNRKRLENLRPGVTYLVCHCSQGSDELTAITPDADEREFERTFFGGEVGRKMFEELGIRTIGMREVRELYRSRAT